ncbi:TlpA family protein disulfide reductase [Bacillus massilinigeriensis]|uniref:TlpA family protein disulfide reductase n=1 Tax=Bacillus mediterraneensis TaxID=1805474 RepID=UPI0008F861F6|nr:TlpA disulfide reductase family protein [Bacillus mediterraneensis]
MIKKRIVVLIFLLSFPFVAGFPINGEAYTIQKAPSFNLKNLDGNEISLTDYKGEKIFLNFWATWCPPCRQELPAIEKLSKEKNIQVLTINLDPENNIPAFMNAHKLSFPVLLDSSEKARKDYYIVSIPTTYLVDEKGYLVKRHIGPMSYQQMQNFIETRE